MFIMGRIYLFIGRRQSCLCEMWRWLTRDIALYEHVSFCICKLSLQCSDETRWRVWCSWRQGICLSVVLFFIYSLINYTLVLTEFTQVNGGVNNCYKISGLHLLSSTLRLTLTQRWRRNREQIWEADHSSLTTQGPRARAPRSLAHLVEPPRNSESRLVVSWAM